jgi:hypothetical protein
MQNTASPVVNDSSVEVLTPAHLPWLLQLLPQVLDPNPFVRNPASNQLLKLEACPGYCSLLLVRFGDGVRGASLIHSLTKFLFPFIASFYFFFSSFLRKKKFTEIQKLGNCK